MDFAESSTWNRRLLTVELAVEAIAPAIAHPLTATPVLHRQTRAIAFVDSTLSDYQTLVAGVQPGTEVYVLDPLRDAVEQITQTLMGQSSKRETANQGNISSVHVFSHGEAGGLRLGNRRLDLGNLGDYANALQSWSKVLTEDADLLLYGCDVATDDRGLAFIQQLSQLTGADVAASNNLTGDAKLGGDWDLEVNTGAIAANLVLSATANYINYQHVLAVDLLSSVNAALGSNSAGSSLGAASMSRDGRYVVFSSLSNELTKDDRNPGQDVFLLDRSTPATPVVTLISRNKSTDSNSSSSAVISADGNYVTFVSNSTGLDTETPYTDINGTSDIFVWERSTGLLNLVSGAGAGNASNLGTASTPPAISDDGGFIAFVSRSNDLTTLDSRNNGSNSDDVFLYDRALKTVSLVSRNTSKTSAGNRGSSGPVISGDGNFVAFVSTATNLEPTASQGLMLWKRVGDEMTAIAPNSTTPGLSISRDGSRVAFATAVNYEPLDTNNVSDVYVWDATTGIKLVSFNGAGTASGIGSGLGSGSTAPVMSSDGRFVAFTSTSTDLVTGVTDDNSQVDVFVRNLATQQTALVSQSTIGATGDNASSNVSISADGTKIAFSSLATNLVTNDTNAKRDVFVRDFSSAGSPQTVLVSRNTAGTIGDDDSAVTKNATMIATVVTPIVSADGNFVAFSSLATNLIAADGNGAEDTFINELGSRATSLVSLRNSDPALVSRTGNGNSNSTLGSAVSADGRYVVFTSRAAELVAGDTNTAQDVFIRNVQTGEVSIVSRGALGNGNNDSGNPAISGDGRFVVFTSRASNLVADDTNGKQDVFIWDRENASLRLISRVNAGVNGGNEDSVSPTISRDGRYVVFVSAASDLVLGDANGKQDVFVWDRENASLRLISSINAGGNSSDGVSDSAVISSNGQFVAFTSNAKNLPDNADGRKNVFVWNRQDGSIRLINRNGETIGNGESSAPVISGNSQFVAFVSTSTNLGGGTDNNNAPDVFVYNLDSGATVLVSGANGGYSSGLSGTEIPRAESPTISENGQFIAFTSTFRDLVSNDGNGGRDVFVRDVVNNKTVLVSVDRDGIESGTGSGTGALGGGSGSYNPILSSDGRFVAFVSFSTNLVTGDENSAQDVFVRDLQANTTRLVSQAGTASGNQSSFDPAIDRLGSYIAFTSDATNLTERDLNNKSDVFGSQLLTTVRLDVVDGAAIEQAIPKVATYKISRSTTQGALTVKLAIDALSTAALTDYTLAIGATAVTPVNSEITITIPDGVNEVILTLTPVEDEIAETAETIKLNLLTGAGYVVPTGGDTAIATITDGDTTVTNTNDAGEGSLRQAILNANVITGANTIDFKITSANKTINLTSALPTIIDAVIIDGRTQAEYLNVSDGVGVPIVEVNGANAGDANGFVIAAGNSTIAGLAINRFTQDGIRISTLGNNRIQKNVITGNGGAGVAIVGIAGNRIDTNSIAANTGLGIDLGADGITANDLGDADGGANNLQNYPILLTAETANGNTIVSGTLNSTVSKALRVEFFSNDVADATGNGEGQTYLGFRDVTTDESGNAIVSFSATGLLTGKFISAIAIDTVTGDTSEFSTARLVAAPKVSIASSVAKLAEGNSSTKPYNFVITLDRVSSQTISVNYSTVNGTAQAGNDFTGVTDQTIEFAPGETTKAIAIDVIGDTLQETDEGFSVTLSAPTNATLDIATAIGLIENDDTPPTIAVANITQKEGQTGDTPYTFNVTLSNPSGQTITVDYTTA
ncbi:MAG: DUF4347 domain-containing protein, partial [Leptolyngbyaceae cyanobacterium CSU_1_3]|nr:DUF4347 domain-containing protein [Leptolyngbyaceae cyanobacterium CSU_1_3]